MTQKPKILKTLKLKHPLAKGRPAHLCSASGLVYWKNKFWIASDDELHLFSIAPAKDTFVSHVKIFKGELPAHYKKRKKKKKDFESLLEIPRRGLLLVPSGSKPNRCEGSLYRGSHVKAPHDVIDFSPLYRALKNSFEQLNIEGAVLTQSALYLAQRGNSVNGTNALIALDKQLFLTQLAKGTLKKGLIQAVHPLELGHIQNVPLSVTDLCLGTHDGELFLSSTAEASKDVINDGVCLGSRLFAFDLKKQKLRALEFSETLKVEGIVFEKKTQLLTYVNDQDDPDIASQLRSIKINLG